MDGALLLTGCNVQPELSLFIRLAFFTYAAHNYRFVLSKIDWCNYGINTAKMWKMNSHQCQLVHENLTKSHNRNKKNSTKFRCAGDPLLCWFCWTTSQFEVGVQQTIRKWSKNWCTILASFDAPRTCRPVRPHIPPPTPTQPCQSLCVRHTQRSSDIW